MAAEYPHWVFFTLPIFCALISGPTLWFLAKKENLPNVLKFLGMSIVGLIYCGLMPSISYQIALAENGLVLFFLHLAVVFSGDISAYFAGRFFGNRKLHETLSPKKTLEGAVGGLFGSVLTGLAWAYFFELEVSLALLLVVFLMTAIFAQLGDLFKSFFKRLANVKDSGGIMPGHGGILDRIDGVIFSSAVFYMFVLGFFKP
ncbi:MAG: phosphatidate cytidylyltransferase [Pseudomonadota bacterium]|nr:phosphatidate cytidylyltransferase [Pseudomonadota bacterium]